jgi:mannose-1-phosphate guanylyltransferase
LGEEYARLEKISVDYAVMERAPNILMARGDFGWDDVGSWPALANHCPVNASSNVLLGRVETLAAHDNIVVSPDRLTALIGVQDLVVVQAEGATLVCHRDRAQDVKQMVQQLREDGRYDDLL